MNQQDLSRAAILLVDDEAPWLRSLSLLLARSDIRERLLTCSDSRNVLSTLERDPCQLIVMDLNMPHQTGLDLLPKIQERHPGIPVIILSGVNEIETAVKCMRSGAFDYFVKTQEEDRLVAGIKRALDFGRLRSENAALRASLMGEAELPDAFGEIVTVSDTMRNIFRYATAVSRSPEPVLITGESGTGKKLIARALHRLHGPDTPYVAVNVAGLDDAVFSDTLFGHLRGAFTGADRPRPGMIERAQGGVLFLDEIGDLSMTSQVKLLRLLQEKEYFPLGSDTPRKVDTRILVATNHDLLQLQKENKFRKDLYYRLKAHHIRLPPLRERRDDIPALIAAFARSAAADFGVQIPAVPQRLLSLISGYSFPGNIRELRALVYDAISRTSSGQLATEPFAESMELAGEEGRVVPASGTGQFPTIREATTQLVNEAMRLSGGNQTAAAKLLGITRPALSKRLKNLEEDGEDI